MKYKIQTIPLKDLLYPPLLKEIPQPPQKLYFIGKLPAANLPTLAIVGTRKATSEGKIIAKQIAKDLARQGIVIVSGLALGIDGAAHEGALAGQGKTIAVLANGLDTIYPRQHISIAQEILNSNGVIVSEYSEGTPSLPNQFLARNRIISGLSLGIIIIEAPIHSGSLVTAKHALDQGREVFIIPGPPNHQNYKGSHMLLRHGARLVSNAEDILEDLDLTNFSSLPAVARSVSEGAEEGLPFPQKNEEKDNPVFNIIRQSQKLIDVDKIIEITKLESRVINQQLTFLLLEGKIEEINGKFKAL